MDRRPTPLRAATPSPINGMHPDTSPHRVVIADPHFLTSEGLTSLLSSLPGYRMAGIALSRQELYRLLRDEPGYLLITDPATFDYRGPDSLRLLKELFGNVEVMLLSDSFDASDLSAYTQLGIRNFSLKNGNREEFTAAFAAAASGVPYFAPGLSALQQEIGLAEPANPRSVTPVTTRDTSSGGRHLLTDSEMEIVRLIASGLTTKEIAARRFLSFHTVNTHRKNIFRKLQVKSVSELVMTSVKAGWIDPIEYYI